MGRINCRNPKCSSTRSTTSMSTDGTHISECFSCGDTPYTEALDQPNSLMSFTQREMDLMRQAFKAGIPVGSPIWSLDEDEAFENWIKKAQFDSSP